MSPSRSINITISNHLDVELHKVEDRVDHGEYTQGLWIKNDIPANQSITYQLESAGIATGAQGSALFEGNGVGTFAFSYNNPNVGANEYSTRAPEGYKANYQGGENNNAAITFHVGH